ncbi:hypothetical protein BX666DRAFT_1935574, partial [Dichotomocladium elegans]
PSFPHAQQCSIYEGRKVNAAYSNNINMRFGQHLRRAVNTLLGIRRQKAIMERDLLDQGLSTEEISARILETVIEPARRFKLAISSRQINTDLIRQQSDVFWEAFQVLLPVLNCYPEGYRFQKDNIYYDCKTRPANHMKAFYQLACLFQRLELPAFNCFPLRRRWSPCYMFIDRKIFCQTFCNDLGTMMTNSSTWIIGMR